VRNFVLFLVFEMEEMESFGWRGGLEKLFGFLGKTLSVVIP